MNLIQHEYGHILQAELWGKPAFYDVIAPESLASASFTSMESHSNYWTETYANYLSKSHFGSAFIGAGTSNYPIQNISTFNTLKLLLIKKPFFYNTLN